MVTAASTRRLRPVRLIFRGGVGGAPGQTFNRTATIWDNRRHRGMTFPWSGGSNFAGAKVLRLSFWADRASLHSRPSRAPGRVVRPDSRAGCASGCDVRDLQDRYALVSFSVGAPPRQLSGLWVHPLELPLARPDLRQGQASETGFVKAKAFAPRGARVPRQPCCTHPADQDFDPTTPRPTWSIASFRKVGLGPGQALAVDEDVDLLVVERRSSRRSAAAGGSGSRRTRPGRHAPSRPAGPTSSRSSSPCRDTR